MTPAILKRVKNFLTVIFFIQLSCSTVFSTSVDINTFIEPESAKNTKLHDAVRLVHEGKIDGAIKIVQKEIEQNPGSASAYELRGAILVLKGDITKGLADLQKAVKLNPRQSSAYTKIGDVHMASGKTDLAEKAFLKTVEISPYDHLAHQRLGIIYDKQGKENLAIAHYEKGIVGTPDTYLGIKVDLARLYNKRNQYGKTIGLLKKQVTQATKSTAPHILLGTAYLAVNKADDAIKHFKIVRSLDPKSESSYLSMGIAYRIKGDFKNSLTELKKVETMKPKWAIGYYQSGETLFAMKNYTEALKKYTKAEQLDPRSIEIKKKVAEAHIALKNPGKAIAIYKQMIDSKQADAATYDLLGSIYQLNGKNKEAENVFNAMRKKFPNNGFAYYRSGLYYGYVKQYDKSIAMLDKAKSTGFDNVLLYKALSVSYSQKGDTVKSIEAAKKYVSLSHEDIESQFYLASLYHDASILDKAETAYRKILSKNQNHVFSLNNLANILLDRGDLKSAGEFAKKAADRSPDNALILDTYGWVLYKQKKHGAAIDVLTSSLKKMPENPVINYHLGLVYSDTGKKDLAKKHFSKALSVSPQFKYADKAKAALKKL